MNMASGLWSWWWEAATETEKLLTTILTIALTTFMLISWFILNVKKPKNQIVPLPPGPRGFPIIGYLPFLGSDLLKKFTQLASIYGPIYKLWLGNKLCVVVSSASLAKELVRDHDATFANRDPPIAVRVLGFGGGSIAWCPYGPDWIRKRKVLVREMLSNANLDACYALGKQEIKKSIRNLYSEILCGKIDQKAVDIGELSFVTNISAVMAMLWGITLEGERGIDAGTEFRALVAEIVVLAIKPNISDLFPVLARFDLQGVERQATRIAIKVENFLNSAIERCMNMIEARKGGIKEKEQRKDYLHILLEMKENEAAETSISMDELKALLLEVVLGGSDTTSTIAEWVMAEIMKHEEIMEKVYQELDEVVGLNNSVEESHLPKLRYLNAVVQEAFRLHPPLPFLVPRRPSKSCAVGGYNIPQGSAVFLNAYAIHRDPQYWENPLEFQPERFLNEDGHKFDYSGNNFQYLPFGSGRRICPGLPLAEKMLIYQLASFLHSFKWKLPNDTKLELSDKFGIVVKKMKPLIAIPTPRLSDPLLYE